MLFDLRFWGRGLSDAILALMAGDCAMRFLKRRRGRKLGFQVAIPDGAVA